MAQVGYPGIATGPFASGEPSWAGTRASLALTLDFLTGELLQSVATSIDKAVLEQ